MSHGSYKQLQESLANAFLSASPDIHTQASPALSLHETSAPSPAIPRHHSFELLQSSTSLLLATHILPNSTRVQ
jgi:hypothetical protein